MNNKKIETKEFTVAQLVTKADTQEDKDLIKAIQSLQSIIPDIMSFSIAQQTFTYVRKSNQ